MRSARHVERRGHGLYAATALCDDADQRSRSPATEIRRVRVRRDHSAFVLDVVRHVRLRSLFGLRGPRCREAARVVGAEPTPHLIPSPRQCRTQVGAKNPEKCRQEDQENDVTRLESLTREDYLGECSRRRYRSCSLPQRCTRARPPFAPPRRRDRLGLPLGSFVRPTLGRGCRLTSSPSRRRRRRRPASCRTSGRVRPACEDFRAQRFSSALWDTTERRPLHRSVV